MNQVTVSKFINTKPKVEKLGNKALMHSTDAEISVIGAMLISPSAIPKVFELLDIKHFYHDKHKAIIAAIKKLFNDNKNVDILTVKEELKRLELYEKAGKDIYLSEIYRKSPASANVEQHCLIVLDKYMKRQATAISYKLYEKSNSDPDNILDVVPQVVNELEKIVDIKPLNTPERTAKNYLDYLAMVKSGKIVQIKTPLTELNEIIGGFSPGDFVIVGARPGVGKTALGVTLALYQCFYLKLSLHFVSIEMTANSLMNRIVSQQTKIPIQDIKRGKFDNKKFDEIIQKLNHHAESNFFIDDQYSDFDEVIIAIKNSVRRNKTKIVIIDNFQNFTTKKSFKTEKEKNTYFSNQLRLLAKQLQIIIISLNQLNRSASSRGKKQPILSDLRDTGDLEQDAQIVIFIDRPETEHREKFDDDTEAKGLADIIVAKNRDGPTGVARVKYIGEIARFEDNPKVDYFDNIPEEFRQISIDEDEEPF